MSDAASHHLAGLYLAAGRPLSVRPAVPGTASGAWPVAGTWPLPNPAHPLVAVSRFNMAPVPGSELLLIDESTGDLVELAHSAPGDPPVISPGVPHYCHWSSDGEYLAFGVATSTGFEVRVASRAEPTAATVIARGSPIFVAWHPGRPLLALHTGQRVEVHNVERGEHVATLTEQAIGFRAPVFTSDGRTLIYASSDGQATTIHSADTDSWATTDAGAFPGGVALSPAGDPGECYVALTRRPESGAFDSLWRLELPSGRREQISRGPFVGLFWSPGRDRYVTVVPRQAGDGQYSLVCHRADGIPEAWSEPFVPSDEFRIALSFFDQYGMSHPFWSPDGAVFVAAGRLLRDSTHSAFSGAGPEALAWPALPRTPFERIGPGSIGIFRHGFGG